MYDPQREKWMLPAQILVTDHAIFHTADETRLNSHSDYVTRNEYKRISEIEQELIRRLMR